MHWTPSMWQGLGEKRHSLWGSPMYLRKYMHTKEALYYNVSRDQLQHTEYLGDQDRSQKLRQWRNTSRKKGTWNNAYTNTSSTLVWIYLPLLKHQRKVISYMDGVMSITLWKLLVCRWKIKQTQIPDFWLTFHRHLCRSIIFPKTTVSHDLSSEILACSKIPCILDAAEIRKRDSIFRSVSGTD